MANLYETDSSLAEQAVAHAFTHVCSDRRRSVAWEVAGFVAGVLLALASAPFMSY